MSGLVTLWVVSGACRGVGKTRVCTELAAVLPGAMRAKIGHNPPKAGKPGNYFTDIPAFRAFQAQHPDVHHWVVESNRTEMRDEADIRIYIGEATGEELVRPDADEMRAEADVCVLAIPGADPEAASRDEIRRWRRAVMRSVQLPETVEAVCAVFDEQRRYLSRRRQAETPGESSRQPAPKGARMTGDGHMPPDAPPRPAAQPPPGTIRGVAPLLLSTTDGGKAVEAPGMVVEEAALTLDVMDIGAYTLLCLPLETRALAAGFLFTQGMINSRNDIKLLHECPDDPAVIRVRIADPGLMAGRSRNVVVTSSCGLCGGNDMESLLAGLPVLESRMHLSPSVLRSASEAMRERQVVFPHTGGTHAAGIFDAGGRLLAFAEDIGRHNALDKVIGMCVLQGMPMAGCGVALSGRVSLELVVKCLRAGLEVVAAVSAPTSLALDAAERCNLTLCCFVRGERATVYTHPGRISG